MNEPSRPAARGGSMSIVGFETLFSRRVRTWVDWDALDDSNSLVRFIVIADREALRNCYTVWYRNHDAVSDWRDQGAHRVRVGEEADRLGDARASEVLDVPHVFPALDLGEGEIMLLDGNHRAVALAAADYSVHVLLSVLVAPKVPIVFPDLIHEVRGLDTPSSWDDCVLAIQNKFGTREGAE